MEFRRPLPSVWLVLVFCLTTFESSARDITTPKRMTTTQDPAIVTPHDEDFELKRTPEEIEATLKKHKIIPDLLDKAPRETIYVEWIDGPSALLGNEITAIHEFECRPFWVNYRNFLEKQHTMLMLGLDEPSAKNRSSSPFLYWLVGNIPPHNWDNVPATDYVRGETFVDYREPLPLQGTGLHRYVFLVYAHDNRTIKFDTPKVEHGNITERLHFSLKDFVKKHDLGEPYAVNCFLAQWQLPPYMYSTDAPTTTEAFDRQTIATTTQTEGPLQKENKKRKKNKRRNG